MKWKSKIPKLFLLITAICVNSFWPWLEEDEEVGGSLLPVAYATSHMTVTAGDTIAHKFTFEMRGQNHYHDDGGCRGESSSSAENIDLENIMDLHGFDQESGTSGVLVESEERGHIAHHWGKLIFIHLIS